MFYTGPNRKKKAWIIGGVSAMLVLTCAGVAWSDYSTIGEERQKIAGLQGDIRKADQRIRRIPFHEKRVLRERERVKEYVKILPDDNEITDFVNRITEFASLTGVEIESLDDKSARSRNSRKRGMSAFVRIVYKLSLMGTTHQLLDFMHQFEQHDRFVKVNQFNLIGGKEIKKRDGTMEEGPIKHAFGLELETYVYNPRKAATRVDIPNGENKLAEILSEEPVESGLALDHYDLVSQPQRRDPFVDPRKALNEAEASPEAIAAQEGVISEMTELLDELLALLSREQKMTDVIKKLEVTKRLDEKAAVFAERVESLDRDQFFSVEELAKRFDGEVVVPFGKSFGSRAHLDTLEFPERALEAQVVKMRHSIEAREFAEVASVGRTLLSRKPSRKRGRIAELYAEITSLTARASAHVEFKDKALAFTGLIFQPKRPDKAIVIINDRAYSPGDAMDDGTIVKSVRPSRVIFVYKGVEIPREVE